MTKNRVIIISLKYKIFLLLIINTREHCEGVSENKINKIIKIIIINIKIMIDRQ